MTPELLTTILKESGATAWEITDTVTHAREFYFIRHRLDQHRTRNVEHIQVKVYRAFEGGQFLGSASEEIHPTATAEEARAQIAGLVQKASYVRNPAYTLNRPDGRPALPLTRTDTAATARAFMETMKALPETETEFVNSYEIFTEENEIRFLNSEGIDVRSVRPASMLEVVLNAREGDHEIETYHAFRCGTCDRDALIRELSDALRQARDKLHTVPTPALGACDVVFSTEDAAELYSWFIARMSAGLKYQKISSWAAGEEILPDTKGDRVTIRSVRELPNSSSNAVYDAEGAPVQDLTLIENGVAKDYHGSRQFREYLGMKEGCIASNFVVSGGTRSAEELRQGDYLEITAFSDFSVETASGAIAGEIRLGYWHHGGEVTPVSGGSISGSMNELARRMHLSREQKQYNSCLIPMVTRVEGVTLTGAV